MRLQGKCPEVILEKYGKYKDKKQTLFPTCKILHQQPDFAGKNQLDHWLRKALDNLCTFEDPKPM